MEYCVYCDMIHPKMDECPWVSLEKEREEDQ